MQILINRILNNDDSACVEFIKKFQGVVIGTIKKKAMILKIRLTSNTLEDLYQDTFIKVFKYLNKITSDTEAGVGSYIKKTAESIVKDYFIKEKKYINPIDKNLKKITSDTDTEAKNTCYIKRTAKINVMDFFEKERENIVKSNQNFNLNNIEIFNNTNVNTTLFSNEIKEKIIENLELKDKEIFILLLEGYKPKEISEILGINKKTVETNIRRAKEKLKNDENLKIYFS